MVHDGQVSQEPLEAADDNWELNGGEIGGSAEGMNE